MDRQGPTWPQVRGWAAAHPPTTLRGTLRRRDDTGDEVFRFVHAGPSSWRVTDGAGVLHVENANWAFWRRGGGTVLERVEKDHRHLRGLPVGHPNGFVVDEPFDPYRYEEPRFALALADAPGAATEVAGRPAWLFGLTHHGDDAVEPWEVVVDDRTGLVLRWVRPGVTLEVLELTVDGPVESAEFDWDGPVDTSETDERLDSARVLGWLESQPLPVIRHRPGGISFSLDSGDPTTGAFVVHLHVGGGLVALARWPRDGEPPEAGRTHEWSRGDWAWGLVLDEPLDPDDLTRVIASMPAD